VIVRITHPSSRNAPRYRRFLRELLPRRRSSVTDNRRPLLIEIVVCSRSVQCVSIRPPEKGASPPFVMVPAHYDYTHFHSAAAGRGASVEGAAGRREVTGAAGGKGRSSAIDRASGTERASRSADR
jgi:hypothetical protein